jgi:hypothetical protein
MRRVMVVAWIALFASVIGYGTLGQTLCDFRMPVSGIEDADMSFAYRYIDDATTPGTDESAGRFSASYSEIFDSPTFGHSASLSTDIALANFVPTVWRGNSAASYRYYVSRELPLFVYGGALGTADTALPEPGLELRGGVGYGRFRDVTPLAQAIRIFARLVELGAIPESLDEAALQAVAAVIGQRDDFPSSSELVSAIEAEIESATRVELDALALLMIEDEIENPGDQRFCGLIVQGGVGQELLDAHGGSFDVRYVMSADAAYPPTPLNQLRLRASLSSSLDVFADHTLLVEVSYDASLLKAASVESRFTMYDVRAPGFPDLTTYTAGAFLSVGTGRSSIIAGVLISHVVGDPGWTVDLSISTAIDLL